MTVRELKQAVKKRYGEENGARFFTEGALLSALFEKCLPSRSGALNEPWVTLSEEVCARILQDLERLLRGEPLQYYLGTEYFCGLELLVAPEVLIPRRDTEVLVEIGEKSLPEGALFFDFCCGSGCIGIALLERRRDLKCISFDLSEAALSLARRNRERFGLKERMRIVSADLTGGAGEEWIRREHPALVISNPPYLAAEEMLELPENVKNEPSLALSGGEDGLLFYRHFLDLCQKTRTPFLCEMGYRQTESIALLAEKRGLSAEFFRDGGDRPRAFFARPR
ncbi:MAG: peptide chain release factor N(5)-glutamine methyltransferase [Clostridia bacterium]|nr:peptide chain release factor N(5)-glutamine methyltransferase [Clostridia bacterium]